MAHSENMKRKKISDFFKPTVDTASPSNVDAPIFNDQPPSRSQGTRVAHYRDPSILNEQHASKYPRIEFEDILIERDPGLRKPIWQHPINKRDEIRRAYIKAGPYQPNLVEYPPTRVGDQDRRFNYSWFKKFPWLEYSLENNAAFCFPCFLFEKSTSSRPAFTTEGFKGWKRVNDGKRCPLLIHEGTSNSSHTIAVNDVNELMNVTRHIDKVINAQTSEEIKKNRLRLEATIESVRWLSLQSCAFRGHDESENSTNRGNFVSMVKLMGRMNDKIAEVVLEKAPKNAKYTSPMIQKEILHIIANKVRLKIREEIGDAPFCILIDEAKDVSCKEQMTIVLRFVDANGFLRERFFQIVQVSNTAALTLKNGICNVLNLHNLQISKIRGQGYDGASNMRGALNGLQAQIRRDSPYAYYVHCFAHRLQLALVASVEKETCIYEFFSKLTYIVNVVSGSPKRLAELKSAQAIEIARMISTGERETGTGANQMSTLHRAGATRWSSHFDSIRSLIEMFGATIQAFRIMVKEGTTRSTSGEAGTALIMMLSFEFIFILHLMSKIMGVTDLLCKALQHKSLDIVNAMDLVATTKSLLHTLKSDGFNILLAHVKSVCEEYDVTIPDFDAQYKDVTLSSEERGNLSVKDHYHINIFTSAIENHLIELDHRFDDEAMELLILGSALEPKDEFKSFKIDNICKLAEKFYPADFTTQEMYHLKRQLEHYEVDVVCHPKFKNMSTLIELCRGLVETKKSHIYFLVDRLIRLVLTLPVSTATTERAFSAMKHIKTNPRNSMEEEFFEDAMVVYIEREFAEDIDSNFIIDEFYAVKNRRVQLR